MHTALFFALGGIGLIFGIGLYDAWRREHFCVSDLPPIAGGLVGLLVACLTWYDVLMPMRSFIAGATTLPVDSFPEVMVSGAICASIFGAAVYSVFSLLPAWMVGPPAPSGWSREESVKGFLAFVIRRAYPRSDRLGCLARE